MPAIEKVVFWQRECRSQNQLNLELSACRETVDIMARPTAQPTAHLELHGRSAF